MATETFIKSEIEELLLNWLYWLSTRRFYAPPLPPNILALLNEDNSRRTKEPPNARNDALCAAFNLVITQAEDGERLPFLYVYLREYRPQPIKALAFDLHIDSDTVYQRAHSAAPKFYNQALKLQEFNASMQKEVDGYVD